MCAKEMCINVDYRDWPCSCILVLNTGSHCWKVCESFPLVEQGFSTRYIWHVDIVLAHRTYTVFPFKSSHSIKAPLPYLVFHLLILRSIFLVSQIKASSPILLFPTFIKAQVLFEWEFTVYGHVLVLLYHTYIPYCISYQAIIKLHFQIQVPEKTLDATSEIT